MRDIVRFEAIGPEAEVEAADRARLTYIESRDFASTARFLSTDLTYAHATGRIDDRESLLSSLREAQGDRRFTRIVTSLRPMGNAVVMTGELVVELGVEDQPKGMTMSFTSVWTRYDGGWEMRAWHATKLSDL